MTLLNLFSLISSLFCCVILLITVQAMVHRNQSGEQRALQAIYYCTIAYLMAEIAWSFVDGRSFTGARELNYFINFVDYIMLTMVSYRWFVYYELFSPSKLTATRLRRFAWRLPVYFLMILTFSSAYTGWFFTIDQSNHYVQGSYFNIQTVVAYIYPAAISAKGIASCGRAETMAEKRTHTTFALYAFILAAFEIVNIFTVKRGIYIHCFSLTAVLLFQFVNQQEQHITRDFLTQMNNRGAMENYLNGVIHSDSTGFYLLMIDVDHFKKINDLYGHTEGDRALMMTANTLKHLNSSSRYFLARYGGDEFVIVHETESEEEIINLCAEIKEKIAQIKTGQDYSLSVSIGYSKLQQGCSLTQWLKEADDKMYSEKAEMYAKR